MNILLYIFFALNSYHLVGALGLKESGSSGYTMANVVETIKLLKVPFSCPFFFSLPCGFTYLHF